MKSDAMRLGRTRLDVPQHQSAVIEVQAGSKQCHATWQDQAGHAAASIGCDWGQVGMWQLCERSFDAVL